VNATPYSSASAARFNMNVTGAESIRLEKEGLLNSNNWRKVCRWNWLVRSCPLNHCWQFWH